MNKPVWTCLSDKKGDTGFGVLSSLCLHHNHPGCTRDVPLGVRSRQLGKEHLQCIFMHLWPQKAHPKLLPGAAGNSARFHKTLGNIPASLCLSEQRVQLLSLRAAAPFPRCCWRTSRACRARLLGVRPHRCPGRNSIAVLCLSTGTSPFRPARWSGKSI